MIGLFMLAGLMFGLTIPAHAQSDPYTDIEVPAGFSNFTDFGDATCFVSGANRVTCSIPDGSHNDQGAQFDLIVPTQTYGLAIDIVSVGSFNSFKFDAGLVNQDTTAMTGDRVCMIDDDVIDAITVTNELGCDQVHSDEADFNPNNTTMRTVIDCPSGGAGCTPTNFVIDIYFIVAYEPPPPPPPPPGPENAPFGVCTFTETITTTGGMTETVVYTRNVNLVENASFEEGIGYRPISWTLGNAPIGAWCSIGGSNACMAYDGFRVLKTDNTHQPWAALQDVALWLDGTYMAGFYAKSECDEGDDDLCDSARVTLSIDGYINGRDYFPDIGGTCTLTDGEYDCPWTPITGTINALGGGGLMHLSVIDPPNAGTIRMDVPFMYPVDPETNQAICIADYYEPYDPPDEPPDEPPDPPDPTGGGPGPDPGPVVVCYACQKPTGLTLELVSKWLSYLACIFYNIFSCSVRIWFMNVVNQVLGVVRWLVGIALWLPTNFTNILAWVRDAVQAAFNFVRDGWVNVITWLALAPGQILERIFQTEFIQAIWRQFSFLSALFDVVITIIQTIFTIANNLFRAAAGLVDLLIGLANAVRDAFAVEAYEIDFIPGVGGGLGPGSFNPESLETAGPTSDKIYWLLVASMASLDNVAGSIGLNYIQFLVIGIMSLILIAWTMKLWHDILPI